MPGWLLVNLVNRGPLKSLERDHPWSAPPQGALSGAAYLTRSLPVAPSASPGTPLERVLGPLQVSSCFPVPPLLLLRALRALFLRSRSSPGTSLWRFSYKAQRFFNNFSVAPKGARDPPGSQKVTQKVTRGPPEAPWDEKWAPRAAPGSHLFSHDSGQARAKTLQKPKKRGS